MPAVPECAEIEEETDFLEDRSISVTTALTSKLSIDLLVDTNTSLKNERSQSETCVMKSLEDVQSEDLGQSRRQSELNIKKAIITSSSKVKLTFVNGHFIDLNTSEGKEIAATAKTLEAGEGPPADGLRSHEILGVQASIFAGHRQKKSGSKQSDDSVGSQQVKRATSDASADNAASVKTVSSHGSGNSSDGSKNAVTSIVALGEGYFLTASRYDRVIKMWRVTDKASGSSSKPHMEFIRDFNGHNTGVTCLTRIDNKGRFLSASKDCSVILWDSRFDCDDEEEDEECRTLLAKFDKMDRRALKTITITEDGEYVRPDDDVDMDMIKAVARKTITGGGSAGLQQAAKNREIICCACEFAAITGHHAVVKVWSIRHAEDQSDIKGGCNCAEVTMQQEIKNDIVIQALTAALDKGLILTGDRLGIIKLWRGSKGMISKTKTWTCERQFSWKKKAELCSVDDVMNFSITSLSFLSEDLFVSGTRRGVLRLWKVDNDNDLVSIKGAHTGEVTGIKSGCFEKKNRTEKYVTFSTASSDGKVLSFAVTLGKDDKGKPVCYHQVHHGITSRYVSNRNCVSVEALECVEIPNTNSKGPRKALISTCSRGDLNVLTTPLISVSKAQDALVLYRKRIEEEALTLHTLAPDLLNCVESRDRKKNLMTYKDCFLGW